MRSRRAIPALPDGFGWASLPVLAHRLPASHVTLHLCGPVGRVLRTRPGRFFPTLCKGMGNSPPMRKMMCFFIFLSRKVSYYCT